MTADHEFPDLSQMSPYEHRAWNTAVARLNSRDESGLRRLTGRLTQPVRSAAASAWQRLPGHEDLEASVLRALEGLIAVTLLPAMKTVSIKRVERRVGCPLDEFLSLDLQRLDRAAPRARGLYTVGALAEGSATALAVTGAEVSTTVTAGTTAGVAIGAVALDIAASIAGMGRIVAVVAAQYGYDVRDPDEEVFALGVLSIGSAGSPSAKVAALSSLSRLTQQMMRRATWDELRRHGLVQLIERIFERLGFNLTKQKLGQAVPIAGVAINAGLSAEMADRTYRRARDMYRVRFLSDKYGINPSSWVTAPVDGLPPDDILGLALDEMGPDDSGDGTSSSEGGGN